MELDRRRGHPLKLHGLLWFLVGAGAGAGAVWIAAPEAHEPAERRAPVRAAEPRGEPETSSKSLGFAELTPANESRHAIESAEAQSHLDTLSSVAEPPELIAALWREWSTGSIKDAEVLGLLFQAHLRRGEYARAFELCELYGVEHGNIYGNLLAHLHAAEHAELRRRVIERMVQCDDCPLHILVAYAPERAVEWFEQRPEDAVARKSSDMQRQYCEALIRVGKVAQARAVIQELLQEDPEDPSLIYKLSRVDPQEAEARLRALVARPISDPKWTHMLFDHLNQQDRPREARALLAEMDRAGLPTKSSDWDTLADACTRAGDKEGAISAWTRALEVERDDPDEWVEKLRQVAPAVLLERLEERAKLDPNDEFWGALGDERYRSGNPAGALAAWQRASELDPEDEEWRERIELTRAQRDPFPDD